MNKSLRGILSGAISLILVPATLATPAQEAVAAEEVLPFQRVATDSFREPMWTGTFSHDDSSLYFAENGASGVRKIISTQLNNAGLPIAPAEDGMASFRSELIIWQNTDMVASMAPGKDGHYWIYSGSGNCTVIGASCGSKPAKSGLWAIDTTDNNHVTRIPLLRANGQDQDGNVFGVTVTPDGKYVYAIASRGSANSGSDARQLFKIDAMTNTQIGLGVEAGFAWDYISSDNNYVYGNNGTYLKVRIDGDQNSPTRDSVAEPLITNGIDPASEGAYFQTKSGKYLLSGWGNWSCNTEQGHIGIVDTLTGVGKILNLPSGVLPASPRFGGDGNIYAFDMCNSKVIKVDTESGAIIAQTTSLPDVANTDTDYPFGAMSSNGKTYVVGGGKTGGLIIVDAHPEFKPTLKTNGSISGTGLQGTYLNAGLGIWKANPVGSKTQQWYRCDKSVAAGLTAITTAMKCSKISGATKTRYKVALVDANKYLTVLVKATNSLGSTLATARSFRVPKIVGPTKTRNPVISGTSSVNSYLSATVGTWSGNPAARTSLQWYRCDAYVPAGRTSLNCSRIPGAATSRYKVKTDDKGKYLTVLVTAANSVGSQTSTARTSAKVG
jgi:hypothetical protein